MSYLKIFITSAIGVAISISQANLAIAASITLPDGSKCEGEVSKGVLNGQATCQYVSKDTYTGAFKDGKFAGTGKYTFAAGGSYQGIFKDRSEERRVGKEC